MRDQTGMAAFSQGSLMKFKVILVWYSPTTALLASPTFDIPVHMT